MAYVSVAASSTCITQRHVRLQNQANQGDPSSPNGSTIGLSKLRPTKRFVSASMFEEGAKPEVGITRNTPVRSVETQSMRHGFVLETEHFKVPCPYVPDMWKAALHAANIHNRYPTLIQDITFGFPIGFNLSKLSFTFLLPNLPSALLQPEFIHQELHAERQAGRMAGPFTKDEAHVVFRGHFRTAPLGLIKKPYKDKPSSWRLIRHLSKKDKNGQSTNSWINSDQWQTKWGTAAMVADFVSLRFTCYRAIILPVTCARPSSMLPVCMLRSFALPVCLLHSLMMLVHMLCSFTLPVCMLHSFTLPVCMLHSFMLPMCMLCSFTLPVRMLHPFTLPVCMCHSFTLPISTLMLVMLLMSMLHSFAWPVGMLSSFTWPGCILCSVMMPRCMLALAILLGSTPRMF